MPFNIESKLVIAVASSALFDLGEGDQVFLNDGEDRYREYQRAHEADILKPGVAFEFVRRLLSLNVSPEDSPVEIILLSRNDPDSGLRVMNSIEAHGLAITRAAFVKGNNPHRYARAFNASLFLSGNEGDVRNAMDAGYPAGLVLNCLLDSDLKDAELRIAFDFDGVIADDAAEAVFASGGLDAFFQSEEECAHQPHQPGPLHELLIKVAAVQKQEAARRKVDPSYKPRLRLAIVTARNAPAHKRLVTSLREWGIEIDETFFLGGMEKVRILDVFRPHIFCDDQRLHLDAAVAVAPCVHIPFGVRNRTLA